MNIILKFGIAAGSLLLSGVPAAADDFLKDFLKEATDDLHQFRDEALAQREAFRDSVLNQMAQWVSQPWEPKPMEPPVVLPHDEPPVPPVILPHDEPSPQPEDRPVRDNPVVAPAPPAPAPAPAPVLPTAPPVARPEYFSFRSFGTAYRVDAPASLRMALPPRLKGNPSGAVNHYISNLDNEAFERLSSSLQAEASDHNLGDWGYHKLVCHFAQAFSPGDPDVQNIIKGLLLTAAGYDVRFGGSKANGRIYLLTGCRELINFEGYYTLEGNTRFYPFEDTPAKIEISPAKFSGTRLISCQPSGKEIFDRRKGTPHRVLVCTHEPHCPGNRCGSPVLDITLEGNLNRMEYLSECPRYLNPANEYSQWNTYASAAISDDMSSQLYPRLRALLSGKTKLEAVNILMKFVEAFDYKLDSEMWGVADRAFFPEETLHYPYRDCEDGAILLTRLVRDLVGLPAALVYYPGHMAAAVAFDTPVGGAYINHNGRRYTVCDPTYYYVNVGVQMPPDVIDASKAVLIPLR